MVESECAVACDFQFFKGECERRVVDQLLQAAAGVGALLGIVDHREHAIGAVVVICQSSAYLQHLKQRDRVVDHGAERVASAQVLTVRAVDAGERVVVVH